MNFDPMQFIYNLKYMGLGMLGILIVMGVIIIVTMILNKVTAPKADDHARLIRMTTEDI